MRQQVSWLTGVFLLTVQGCKEIISNKFYGKDFIPYIGIRGFVINTIRTLGLFGIYLMAYVFKGKIWIILFPLKSFYDRTGVST